MRIIRNLSKILKFRNIHYNTTTITRNISFIGQGFYNNEFKPIVHKTILENPDWYSAYTSYQSEISQGRLTLLYQYQNMIKMITGMDIANAGLLDHMHSIFESIQLCYSINKNIDNPIILVDKNIYENHFSSILNYEKLIWNDNNLQIKFVDFNNFDYTQYTDFNIIGCLAQTVDKFGYYSKNYNSITQLKNIMNNKKIDMLLILSCDLLHHTILKSPKELGANIAIGNLQRLGIPLWYGGPHSCFFACDYKYLRYIPGKLVTKATDKYDNLAYRLALQTREQHIKRENANSNICTNQNLFNLYSTAWLMNIGIQKFTKKMQNTLSKKLELFGENNTFDTMIVNDDKPNTLSYHINNKNIYTLDDINIQSLTKTTLLGKYNYLTNNIHLDTSIDNNLNDYIRDKPISKNDKNHYFFDLADDPLELMRYLNRLQKQDFSLLSGMIPLGSCTMKYNPVETLKDFSFEEYNNIHPYQDNSNKNVMNINEKLKKLNTYLKIITGFNGCSIQPLSGAHSELMSLMMIKKYFKIHNQHNKKYILIPESAHGTNPCSATIAGFKVISLKQTKQGLLDIEYFDKIIKEIDTDDIAGSMITYPNTYGIFDKNTKYITSKIKEFGGFNYLDGANMNSWMGRFQPRNYNFDIMHINLHKTLAIPHGGGGPGMGTICCSETLKPYLPNHFRQNNQVDMFSIGQLSNTFYGNTLAGLVSLNYMENIAGKNNLFNPITFSNISGKTVENTNFVVKQIEHEFSIPFRDEYGRVAHEFIIDCSPFKKYNINSNHIAKRFIDYSIHPPTLNWPVHNSLMIEITETENDLRIKYLIDSLLNIKNEILTTPQLLLNAPHSLSDLIQQDWNFNYSKEEAFYPLGKKTKDFKFFPIINHINDSASDRLLLQKLNNK